MPIDLSQIKKKLNPPPDGQDVLRLRVGVVTAVNVDGTVDLALSGVAMTGLPKLAGAVLNVGQVVQILSYRGSLMVLGGTGETVGETGPQPFVRDAAKTNSAAVTAETVVSTLASRTYRAGRAYEVWVGGGVIYSANSAFSAWNVKKGTTTGGATVVSFPRHSNGAATALTEQHLNLRAVFSVDGSDVTTQLCLTLAANGVNTAQHAGSNVNPRHITVLPAGFTSAWTNAATLS